ncbi:hypothetical protein Vadar_009192 [Vaccinium darrowii]|uniref:Uncharacterized protein n=1 Tax=Vaccinium darrowii TaxID=229202 RepID=A0ACB7X8S6_9ERIC|nr:hypothetical protein Vadar_009192 [Vaccinium darrowii]
MFGLQFISDNLGGLAIDEVIKAWKYLRNCTKNLDDLQAKMINLGMRRDIIRRKVREANHRGEEVEADVLQWQAEANGLTIDVEQLIQESTVMVSIMRQYQLSKQAEEKIAYAEKLIEKSYFTDISHCRPRPPELESLSDKNYVDLKSRTPILKDIMDALKDSNVNIIGVCGLGGVGKTTLVKEVGEQMRQGGTFQQVALAIVSKDLNVKEIQSKLADSLNFDLESTGDEANRATKLWNKFNNGDKYLVILDDIWGKVDLMTIGIPITDGNTGCKVVLTSRKKDLLSITMKANRNFSIPELPEEEAWDLFKKKVGNSIESQSEIYSLAREVCRKCKGLPVAINALGAALQDKRDYAWKNALDKLERCMLTQIEGVDPSVEASLRVSYDMLQSLDAQSCFLLCCSFAQDADIPIYKLTRHYIASSLFAQNSRTYIEARNAVCIIIDALKSASLLTTGGHEEAVKIHDVIRDVGVSIAREEKAFLIDHGVLRWPRNPTNKPSYSAISLSFNNIRELPDGLVYPQLHTLMVDNSELSNLEVPDNFFNGMAQLTVLTFKRFRMRRLPSSLAKLTNLQMLSLNGCELEDIAILKELKCNLEVLDLQGSRIEALPPEIGQLASLRVLDIESCDKLTVIPRGVISNLTSLEVLYFPKEFDAWEATIDEQQDMSSRDNVSLEELRWLLNNGQLIYLKIHIPEVTLLPKEGLIFANLIEFTISMGSRSEDPKALIFGTCSLEIQGVQLRSEFIPLVDKAQVLKLGGIKGLKKVLHDRGIGNGCLNLKYLEVTSCDDDLEDLLGEPKLSMQSHGLHPSRSFKKLAVLIIKKCKLKFLFSPTTAREFVHLERLEVRSCEIIEAIVGFEVQDDENELIFSKLRILELGDLPNLTSFYAEKEKTQKITGSSFARPQPLFSPKVVLPVLEKLNVEELDGIEEIWDKQSPSVNQKTVSFGQLRKMTVRQCKKLMNLVPSNILPRLGNLQTLNVGGCPNVKFIVFKHGKEGEAAAADNTLINIPQLRSLSIWNMENLKSFYSSSTTSNAQSLFNHQVYEDY